MARNVSRPSWTAAATVAILTRNEEITERAPMSASDYLSRTDVGDEKSCGGCGHDYGSYCAEDLNLF